MLTSEQQTHKPKQSKIRYTEYYDLQSTLDRLFPHLPYQLSMMNVIKEAVYIQVNRIV